jgi:hypothetical protein
MTPKRKTPLRNSARQISVAGVAQIDDRAVRSLSLTGFPSSSEQEAECDQAIAEARKQIRQRIAQTMGGRWEDE